MRVVKNDTVKILSGKYKGKEAKVLKTFPKEEKVIIEGVNIIKRHTRPSQQNQQGGIIEKEGPVHVSKVMVVCDKCNRPTRVGHKYLEDGSKVRVCKHSDCGEILTVKA
ncbi:MAG: 50S ribosomal protein L24 [Caldithrix sp.]|nr:50S ribosomal protein L24 [Caldithrix sp.]